jgi:DNA mismatch repair protein MutS2
MLAQGSQELENLLASLMLEKQKAEALSRDLSLQQGDIARRKTELDTEITRLKDEKGKVFKEARDGIVIEMAKLQKDIRQAASVLRKEKSSEALENARKAISSAQSTLQKATMDSLIAGESSPGSIEDSNINIGDTVWVNEAGLSATVLTIFRDAMEIEVQAGRTKMRLGLNNVEKIKETGKPPKIRPAAVKLPAGRPAQLELDLRGKRADEVEWVLDGYLSDAVQSGINEARIIHGIATGTVRSIVRDYLASHPAIKSFRSGGHDEGGDGVTVVRFQ